MNNKRIVCPRCGADIRARDTHNEERDPIRAEAAALRAVIMQDLESADIKKLRIMYIISKNYGG